MPIKKIEIELDISEIEFAINCYVRQKYGPEVVGQVGEYAHTIKLIVGPSIINGVGFQPKCEGALVTVAPKEEKE